MDIKDTLTLLFSFGAVIFSFVNYTRGNRFENENHIFKTKIDIYTRILGELQGLIGILDANILEAQEHLKSPTDENKDRLDDQADMVDDVCFKFHDFSVANSLIIPEDVMNNLHQFCEKILDIETIDSETKNTTGEIAEIEKAIDELVDEADKINAMLRRDLHVDTLNSSLYKRLK